MKTKLVSGAGLNYNAKDMYEDAFQQKSAHSLLANVI
jgi:hypothetical protein